MRGKQYVKKAFGTLAGKKENIEKNVKKEGHFQ